MVCGGIQDNSFFRFHNFKFPKTFHVTILNTLITLLVIEGPSKSFNSEN